MTGPVYELSGGNAGAGEPNALARIAALETDMQQVRAVRGRLDPLIVSIDARTNQRATKQELEQLRSDMTVGFGQARAEMMAELGKVRLDVMVELAGKATTGTVWTAGISLTALVIAAAAFGAIYMPYLATLLRRAAP